MLFPELGLSSYAIDDLLLQDALLDAVERAIDRIAEGSRRLYSVLVVGAPLRWEGRLFNAAVVIHRGAILGAVPKSYCQLPGILRASLFHAGLGIHDRHVSIVGQGAPFGVDLLFRASGSAPFTFHVEICEDIWVPTPPSARAALAGAEVLLNLSASNITIGKAETSASCARPFRAHNRGLRVHRAGPGESTTDLAWTASVDLRIWRAARREHRFARDAEVAFADIDLGRLRQERMRMNSFGDCMREELERATPFRTVAFQFDAPEARLRWNARSNASHTCRPMRSGCARIATRLTISKFRPGAAARISRRKARRRRRFRRPRLRASPHRRGAGHGFIGGSARTCCLYASGLRHSEQTKATPGADPRARRQWRGDRHTAVASRCWPISAILRSWRARVRRHVRKCSGRRAHRLSLPSRQSTKRPRRRTGPLRTRPRLVHLRRRRSDVHYNVNASVAKTLIQHLIRFVRRRAT